MLRPILAVLTLLLCLGAARAETAPADFLKGCFYPLVPNTPCEQQAKAHPDWNQQWAARQEKQAQFDKNCPQGSPCWTAKLGEWEDARREVRESRDQQTQDAAQARFDVLRRQLCGADWEPIKRREFIGLSFDKLKICTGEYFSVAAQLHTANGILTTYRIPATAEFMVLGGKITAWQTLQTN